jgi:hypothetical protein
MASGSKPQGLSGKHNAPALTLHTARDVKLTFPNKDAIRASMTTTQTPSGPLERRDQETTY